MHLGRDAQSVMMVKVDPKQGGVISHGLCVASPRALPNGFESLSSDPANSHVFVYDCYYKIRLCHSFDHSCQYKYILQLGTSSMARNDDTGRVNRHKRGVQRAKEEGKIHS